MRPLPLLGSLLWFLGIRTPSDIGTLDLEDAIREAEEILGTP